MTSQWEEDRLYMERKFTDPDFYRNADGMPFAEMLDRLEQMYQDDQELPRPLAKARAFDFVLNNVAIDVSVNDYFPGLESCLKRPLLKSHMAKWAGELYKRIFTEEELDDINRGNQTRLLSIRMDFDHCVPDWDAVLDMGFSGLLERACRYEKAASGKFESHPEYRVFYESIRIEYNAALSLLERLILQADKLPECPRKAQILTALKQLRNGSPRNTYEALLQIWIYFQISEYVDIIQTRSFGNLDRVLYPYYRRDIDSGEYTEKDIRYFFRSFMYQATAMHYKVGHPFYFGGTNEDSSSAINELSYLILDEYDDMKIYDPKLQIKVSENTPRDFIDHALDMIRRGSNSIAFVGEPCIIRTMQKYGYSLSEARTADIKGCYEYCARGSTVETAPVTVNLPKVLGLVLHNGVEPLSGHRMGLETGTIEELNTFPRLYRAFLRQLFYQFDKGVKLAMRMEEKLDEINPAPMVSGTFESSLQQAQDGYAKGAKYNNTNLWICGAATTADSLTMIKRYVFERKCFSLQELAAMLDRDFQGDELVRQRLLNDPERFGNNLEFPDRLTVHFTSAVARRYNGKKNSRGGFFTTSLHSSNRFAEWADSVEATADGRRKGDELNKNMTSTQGSMLNGATALIASVLKFDSSCFMGDLPVDIMLHPSEIAGEAGLNAMRALLMTYIKNYGHAIHFNVMDVETLRKAQENPEQYRDLQVRICGWNQLWNSVPRREQDAYIRQAEVL